ncbi:hypothetical protein [Streptomyces sp. NPDC050287]|uniref:hypothetical protein n=1 Tax=Streptomyces sp. NPDC050287 TaxID=3365608 RepID=UPI0037961748
MTPQPSGRTTTPAWTTSAHPSTSTTERYCARAAAAVAPGGLLIIVEHASIAPWSWQAGKDVHLPRPDEVRASLKLDDSWTAERCHAPQRTPTGPEGQQATVTDNVLALHRAS